MPKTTRTTDDPFGKKLLLVLADKGHPDDLNFLADAFGVQVQSTYDWIKHGRFSKERFPRLVEWSGRSLHWWFDISTQTVVLHSAEPVATYDTRPAWPFPSIDERWVSKQPVESRAAMEALLLSFIKILKPQIETTKAA